METLNQPLNRTKKKVDSSEVVPYSELHRPQYHFSPKKNWMNDPNGLIYFNGIYHMYFQYNPNGNQWGHMSWGHAISTDLIHWEEQEPAIKEKDHMIFSGTTAVGKDQNTLIAAFTSFEHGVDEYNKLVAKAQHQSIALSKNEGYSFEEIKENPVLDIGSKEFRDPKLFFDERTQNWNMLVSLAIEHKIAFYQSKDLLNWKRASEFGPLGNTEVVWECPDLFCLSSEDGNETKWILTVSAGHPEKGHLGMQYFIGEFDGTHFYADLLDYPLYLDFGKDFYAGITFSNVPQKQFRTMIAWVGSHIYSANTPTWPWRGIMSLPQDLYLKSLSNGWVLQRKPPHHYLEAMCSQLWERQGLRLFNGAVEPSFKSKAFTVKLNIKGGGAELCGIKVLKSKLCETIVGVNYKTNEVFIDRRNSSTKHFDNRFPSKDCVPLNGNNKEVKLDIFVDHSVLEVFINEGEQTITSLVFPDQDCTGIKLFSENGETVFENIEIRTIKSIWK